MTISSKEKLRILKKAREELSTIKKRGGYIDDILSNVNERISHYRRLARNEKKSKKAGNTP